jgi:hypothetical protein
VSTDLTVRYAADREDARALFHLLMGLYDEVGVMPMDPVRALASISEVIQRGAALIVHDAEGAIIGSLGLLPVPYWYAQGHHFLEIWCYVQPPHRDGRAFELMLAEATKLSDETGLAVSITLHNPRRRRIPHTRAEHIGAALRYLPNGASILIPGAH